MTFKLEPLPYGYDALSPYMSEETLKLHHDKHHETYVNNLNKLLEDSDLKGKTLKEIIVASYKKPQLEGIFNNAAQNYNHIKFWKSMKLNTKPSKEVQDILAQHFGSFEKFKEKMIDTATKVFGSGWAWLEYDESSKKLDVNKYPNGVNPLAEGKKPILGIDVWEHSYYVDYRNKRPDYLKAWFENLINWEYVEKKLNNLK